MRRNLYGTNKMKRKDVNILTGYKTDIKEINSLKSKIMEKYNIEFKDLEKLIDDNLELDSVEIYEINYAIINLLRDILFCGKYLEGINIVIDFNIENVTALIIKNKIIIDNITGIFDTPRIIDEIISKYKNNKITVYIEHNYKFRNHKSNKDLLEEAGFIVKERSLY